MSTIIIPRRMPGTGTILDLADERGETRITLGGRYHYAVGGPAYYGLRWTSHETLDAAIRRARRLSDYNGITILDSAGRQAVINMGEVSGWTDCEQVIVE